MCMRLLAVIYNYVYINKGARNEHRGYSKSKLYMVPIMLLSMMMKISMKNIRSALFLQVISNH